jgi:hypothetical protein
LLVVCSQIQALSGRTAGSPSLGEQELNLEPQLPVRTVVRCHHILESLQLEIHRQPPEADDLPGTTAQRHGPAITAVGLPVGGNDRCTRTVETETEDALRKREARAVNNNRSSTAMLAGNNFYITTC